MKRTLTSTVAAFFICSSTLFAQGGSPMLSHLPPYASQIYHLNLPVLTSKVSWEELISNFPTPKKEGNQKIFQLLKDPSLAGVDIHKEIFAAQSSKITKLDSTGFLTVLLPLSDSGKFIAFIREQDGGKLKAFKTPNGKAYGESEAGFAYDNKLAVVTFVIKKGNGKQAPSTNYALAAATYSLTALHGYSISPFLTDADFLKGISDDADIHVWMPQGGALGSLMKDIGKKTHQLGFKFGPGSGAVPHVMTSLRFDAGKIVIKGITGLKGDTLEFMKKLNSRPLNTDLFAQLPGNDVLGAINVHFNFDELAEGLSRIQVRSTIDSLLSRTKLSLSDIQHAFKGDILISAVTSDTSKKPSFLYVFTINDMMAFLRFAGKVGLAKDSAGFSLGKSRLGYSLRGNVLVVGSSKAVSDAYFSAPRRDISLVSDDMVKNAPFSIVIDAKAIGSLIRSSTEGQSNQKSQMAMHFIDALDRLTLTAGSLTSDNKGETYFELKMANASQNSLKTLLGLLH